jgi:hypothetical protein
MTTGCPGPRVRNRPAGSRSAGNGQKETGAASLLHGPGSRSPPPDHLWKRPINRPQTPPQALPQPLRAMGTLQWCAIGIPGLRKDGCQPFLHTHTLSIQQKRGLSSRAAKNFPEIYSPKPSRLARCLDLPAGPRKHQGRIFLYYRAGCLSGPPSRPASPPATPPRSGCFKMPRAHTYERPRMWITFWRRF